MMIVSLRYSELFIVVLLIKSPSINVQRLRKRLHNIDIETFSIIRPLKAVLYIIINEFHSVHIKYNHELQ